MFGKLLSTGAALAATSLLLATPALAQDCFNASRSTQGNTAAASNAGTWWDVPEILSDLAGLTDSQIATVLPVINADSRIPANFTVFYNPAHPGELARSMPERNATNGQGIDHSDDYSTPVFQAIFEDVTIALS
jgi:hypothetical protein